MAQDYNKFFLFLVCFFTCRTRWTSNMLNVLAHIWQDGFISPHVDAIWDHFK
jgi:hypothetical protein